jgi:5-methyltetrahydropteroyltriglutamate--homocysteine methyltransferase
VITTVIGSYPKIPDLPAPGKWRSAVEKFQKGQLDAAGLLAVEDEVTREAIADQVEAGVDLITDGQIRWEDGQTHFARKLRGFSINGLQRYFDTNVYFREPVADGPVEWTGPITVDEFTFARSHSVKPVKAVVTGPFTLASLSRNAHYPSQEAYVAALAQALNAELRALTAAGAEVLQVDEPALCQHKDAYGLFAAAMRTLLDGVKAKTILCTYFGDVGGVYPQLLELPFDVLGLDFVAGHRNWDVIRSARFTKELQFGLLDARNTRVETTEEIVSAVRRMAEIVPLERVTLAPSAGLEFLPHGVARKKLRALVTGGRAAADAKGARA